MRDAPRVDDDRETGRSGGITTSDETDMSTFTTDRHTHHIARIGDIEHPAPGRWSVHRSSVIRSSIRRHRLVGPVEHGVITFGAGPSDRSLELSLHGPQSGVEMLAATAIASQPTHDGFARWVTCGVIGLDTEQERAIALTVDFHGVYRRGNEHWAWITGRGRSESMPRRRHRHRPLAVEFDVIAHPAATTE